MSKSGERGAVNLQLLRAIMEQIDSLRYQRVHFNSDDRLKDSAGLDLLGGSFVETGMVVEASKNVWKST